MAGNGFDRTVINPRERPLSSDINSAQSQLDRTLREVAKSLFTSRVGFGTPDGSGTPPSGFIGDAFKARGRGLADMSVVLSKGLGFQYLPGDVPSGVSGIGGLDDLSPYKPLELLADAVISGIPNGDPANPRIDIIEVRMNRALGNPLSRDVLDTGTGVFVPTSVNKTLSFTQDGSTGVVTSPAASTAAVSYKVGVAGGVPVEPSVTTGYVKVAAVYVPASATALTRANFIDKRLLLAPYGEMNIGLSFGLPAAAGPAVDLQVTAPPGVEVVVAKSFSALFDIFIFCGDLTGANVAVQPSLEIARQQIPGGGASFYFLQFQTGAAWTAPMFGLLNGTDVTNLANAVASTPAATYPLGTPYIRLQFNAYRCQTGGVVDGNVEDPNRIRGSIRLQLY